MHEKFEWKDLLSAKKALGMTEVELAKEIGVSPSTLRGWRDRKKVPLYAGRHIQLILAMRED